MALDPIRGVRRDENEGLLLPSEFDQDTKQQMYEFELMSASIASGMPSLSVSRRNGS